MELLHLKW